MAPISSLNCHSRHQTMLSILLTKTAEFGNSSPTSFKMQALSCWQDFMECTRRHGRTLPETKRERSQVKTSCGLVGQGRQCRNGKFPCSGSGLHLVAQNSHLQRSSTGCCYYRAENKIIHTLLMDLMLIRLDTQREKKFSITACRKTDSGELPSLDGLSSWSKIALEENYLVSAHYLEKANQQNPLCLANLQQQQLPDL